MPRPRLTPLLRRPPSPSASPKQKTWPLIAACATSMMVPAMEAAAQAERVVVTRKIADLYGIQGDDVLLMTTGCEVYALATPARLEPDAGRMVLKFDAARQSAPTPEESQGAGRSSSANPATCTLRDMLKPQPVPRGRYQVRLSYDSADWYVIEGTSLLLRTVGCQRRSMREPAVWFQPMEGKGVIEYRSGAACSSDGVFGSLRRQARINAATAQRR